MNECYIERYKLKRIGYEIYFNKSNIDDDNNIFSNNKLIKIIDNLLDGINNFERPFQTNYKIGTRIIFDDNINSYSLQIEFRNPSNLHGEDIIKRLFKISQSNHVIKICNSLLIEFTFFKIK